MFRLSKIADYGIVLIAHLAREEGTGPHNARELADSARLPAPVVSKILKTLARQGVIDSQRGSKGGYALLHRPQELTVAKIIAALEGPVALTECSIAQDLCVHEGSCQVRGPLQVINQAVLNALSQVTLADLIDPSFVTSPGSLSLLGMSTPSKESFQNDG